MAFADFYPLAAFAKVADASWWRSSDLDRPAEGVIVTPEQRRATGELDRSDSARLDAHRDAVLIPAIKAHLAALRDQGALTAAIGLAGRDVWPARAWNALVAGEPDTYETKWLYTKLSHGAFTRAFVRMDGMRRSADRPLGEHVPPTDEKVREAWEAICAAYDGGTSGDQHTGWGIESPDGKTGDRCELVFENWRGRLMRRNAAHALEPAEDVVQLPLSAVGIDVPSGSLLLTDTLRLDGFDEGTGLGDAEYREFSLNSEKGCLERTRVHAERHNLAYCQTTNTFLPVFRNDATGDIAFMDAGRERMKGWTKAGDISCDVWRITAIDRSAAAALMTAGGNAQAEAELDRYLGLAEGPDAWIGEGEWKDDAQAHHEQCYSRNVLKLDVAPGWWTFHSGPEFGTRAKKSAFGLPRTAKPWAVLQAPRAAS